MRPESSEEASPHDRESGDTGSLGDENVGDRSLRDRDERPLIGDLFPDGGVPFDEQAALAKVKGVVDGEYAGLRVEVHEVTGAEGRVSMKADIFDDSGQKIGVATRDFFLDSKTGGLVANHAKLEIKADARGNGFAGEFNGMLESWYRQSGVESIVLRANIDVGSYAWARQGYEFDNHQEAVERILPRLKSGIARTEREIDEMRQEVASLQSGPERESLERKISFLGTELFVAHDIVSRFHLGSKDFPTPKEISDLGRPAGVDSGDLRDQWWLGKRVFMEPGKVIGWQGRKRL